MAFEFEFDLAAAPQEPQRHYVIASAFCRGAALPTHAAVRDALRQYAATMGGSAIPTMFGRLNLIFCTSEIEYDLWKAGTEYLQELARELGPVSKEVAQAHFDERFEDAGVSRSQDSGKPDGEV